jgi:hypothetical protein
MASRVQRSLEGSAQRLRCLPSVANRDPGFAQYHATEDAIQLALDKWLAR